MLKRANVYIDGFNLYYGALRDTSYKWLDLAAMCDKLLPRYDVHRIRYFTARIASRPSDVDAPKRQAAYLRALATNPKISLHYGRFQESRVRMPVASPAPGCPRTVEVIKTEEKGTDVNIATSFLLDAFRGDTDVVVLISNDADLAYPMGVVASQFAVSIGIINPFRHPCRELVNLSPSFYKQLRKGVLHSSQLPPVLKDRAGPIWRPAGW